MKNINIDNNMWYCNRFICTGPIVWYIFNCWNPSCLCLFITPQCELLNWADVLDKLDEVLDRCCGSMSGEHAWSVACDRPGNERDRQLLLIVLQFSALLIEHSFTRYLYSSMEHLTTLLSSNDMTVVLAVIDVLYVFR